MTARQDWRDVRRQAARETILRAAWSLVEEHGLAALSLRELAQRAGITTPTVYAYFASKHAIYDAMFGDAAQQWEQLLDWSFVGDTPAQQLTSSLNAFLTFCTADVARYQLLFQRTIPGFEPSPEAYAPAVRSLEVLGNRLAALGADRLVHIDLWTALCNGLADQQISNDPGGDRWIGLVDQVVAMFLWHIEKEARHVRTRSR